MLADILGVGVQHGLDDVTQELGDLLGAAARKGFGGELGLDFLAGQAERGVSLDAGNHVVGLALLLDNGSGGHGVAVFRRCDAADRTGGLPDSRCGLGDTAAAPRERKNGCAAVPRHLGAGIAAVTAQADRGGLCAAVRPVPDREISDRVPSAGFHAAERQAGVF